MDKLSKSQIRLLPKLLIFTEITQPGSVFYLKTSASSLEMKLENRFVIYSEIISRACFAASDTANLMIQQLIKLFKSLERQRKEENNFYQTLSVHRKSYDVCVTKVLT